MFEPKKLDSTKPSSPTSPVTRSSPSIPPAMMPTAGSGFKSPLQGPVIARPVKKRGIFKTIFIVILLLGLLAAGGEIYLLMTAQAELQAKLQTQSNAAGEVAALAKAK